MHDDAMYLSYDGDDDASYGKREVCLCVCICCAPPCFDDECLRTTCPAWKGRVQPNAVLPPAEGPCDMSAAPPASYPNRLCAAMASTAGPYNSFFNAPCPV